MAGQLERIQASGEPEALPSITPRDNCLFQLPAAVGDFTGREDEVRRMVERLSGVDRPISLLVWGMGGVGKTMLARKVAHTVTTDHFCDAQIELNLQALSEAPLTSSAAMRYIIHAFHPREELPDQSTLLARYLTVLHGKRALILLDNVKDEEQIQHLITAPLPVRFIVTSRNALDLDGLEPISLDGLPIGKSVELLRKITTEKGTDDELQQVAEFCGRLPLALSAAGRFLRLHANWSAPQYIEALKDEHTRLKRLKGNASTRDVGAVLALSARELVRENIERAERWQMLSVFPADFDMAAVAAVWGLTDSNIDSIIKNELTSMIDCSLVNYDTETNRYSLHDLMRPIAREVFAYAEGRSLLIDSKMSVAAAERRFAEFYCCVLTAADDLFLSGNDTILRGLMLFDCEEVNIRHGQAWAMRHLSSISRAAELCRDYSVAGPYVSRLRLSARERIAWLEEATTASREIGDRRGESRALGNLGVAWASLGDDSKAIAFYEQALAIFREIGNRRGESGALGNLGIAWASLGDDSKAIAFYEQALVISREIGDRRGEEGSLGNLGNAYASLGDLRKAIAFYEQALAISREIGDRSGESSALGNLGDAWTELRNAHKAIPLIEQALAISREMGDQDGEAQDCWLMARALAEIGLHSDAICYAEKSLFFYESIGHLCVEKKRETLASWRVAVTLAGDAPSLSEITPALVSIEQTVATHAEPHSAAPPGIMVIELATLMENRKYLDCLVQIGDWCELHTPDTWEFEFKALSRAKVVRDREGHAVSDATLRRWMTSASLFFQEYFRDYENVLDIVGDEDSLELNERKIIARSPTNHIGSPPTPRICNPYGRRAVSLARAALRALEARRPSGA